MPGISHKVLVQQLRERAANGLGRGTPTREILAPVKYALTDYGRSVLPLVEEIRVLGRAHLQRPASQSAGAITAR